MIIYYILLYPINKLSLLIKAMLNMRAASKGHYRYMVKYK